MSIFEVTSDGTHSLNEEAVRTFFYWMNERHRIYLKKEAGEPWPWTEDEILQTYKFTNVFRELDTGTVWLRENMREPYADHPELFFGVCWYRQLNRIEVAEQILEEVGFIDDWPAARSGFEALLRSRAEQGLPNWTGAYMITGTLGGDKITQIVYKVLDPLWKRRVDLSPHPGDDLEDAFERLCKQTPGFGPFLAYEVVSDLRWTPLLEDADDIWQWANPGPGAMRGINRLLDIPVGRHPTKRRPSGHPWYYPVKVLDKEEYIGWMEELMYISEDGWLDDHVPELEMRDVEHSLCEYDKYMRTKLGQGRPRSKYTPPHER